MTTPLKDADLRTLLNDDLRARYPNSLIRDELGVSAGERRVDVAVITPDLMLGYEIKSDTDTLARLRGQADAYAKVFDRLTLITTHKHLDKAHGILPRWWGITVAEEGRLHRIRHPLNNPSTDTETIVQLLWREEALRALTLRGAARGLTKSRRWIVWQRLLTATTTAELKATVRDGLRSRDWTAI